ncbi:MAG TPA: ZIP family metal transporter [Nitrososphaerales archaeon]|nr:ZIP family metal transporter [Nitrososphaerales archaeon]
MVDVLELVLLGSFAGFTIFLGLPIVLLGISDRMRGFLNAFAVGILMFLIVDVFSHAWTQTTDDAVAAFSGSGSFGTALTEIALMFGGITLGLLGLVAYERRYMGRGADVVDPTKVSTMTALGIGAHNLSEGLAIGQSFAFGAVGLGIVLVIGFAAHNTTEGFGITAPLTALETKPRLSFLAKVLFIGGVPTLIGTLLGSIAYSPEAYVFFLAFAGGALVYVTMLMFNTGRRRYSSGLMMGGIFLGLCLGFLTDLIVSLGGA